MVHFQTFVLTFVVRAVYFGTPGTEVSIARKGRDNYCFVTFKSAEVAKDFMARHNHQLLREFEGVVFV